MANYGNSSLVRALNTVFLDRDGILNEKMPEGRYVTGWSEFKPIPGVAQAIARLCRAGLRVLVVSNQRGIALGLYTADDVRIIHSAFQSLLDGQGAVLDGLYFCPHDKEQCNCRKPLPGLFEQALADFPEITADKSVMIGDSASDIEFGRRLGMLTIFIESASGQRKLDAEAARALADLSFASLVHAVDYLVARPIPD